MRWFQDKRVFVTGGSSGIGKETAKLLASWGARVMIAARGEERLDEARHEIEAGMAGEHAAVHALSLDVADKAAVGQAVPQVLETLGGLDLLVNNAGIAHPGYIQEIPDEIFDAMMQVNYFGTVNVTRAFLPHFVAQRAGNICNVCSTAGFIGIFGYTAYAASKFAVSGFSDCLRQELLPYGVKVSVVFPPDTDTPQFHAENKIKPPETKAIAGNIKLMQPQDVARVLLDGVASGRYHIIPGFSNKFTIFMYRHFPWMVRAVIDGDLKKYRAKRS